MLEITLFYKMSYNGKGRGDKVDREDKDKYRKTRSERHQPKEDMKEQPKTRSERHYPNEKQPTEANTNIDTDETEQPKTRQEKFGQKTDETDADSHEEGTGKGKKKFIPRFKTFMISIGSVFILALIAYTIILYGGKLFIDEDKLAVSPPTTIETEDGTIISYEYDQYRLPLDLEEIPEDVQDAFVMTEDKRFYSHSGLDFRSIFRALYKDIISRSKAEGGSTITQQVAKNLFLTNDKSWLRKTKEVMIALYLEREFSKDEILELYLNAIYFGQGQYGVEAASNKFFYKSADELTLDESALLAGIVNAPNGYSPIDHPEKALDRRNLVLERMYEGDIITEEEKEEAGEQDLGLNVSQQKSNPAYQAYVDMVKEEAEDEYGISEEELKKNRYQIKTGLNEEAQQIAYDQFQYDGYFPQGDGVEGAFVMMDVKSGELAAAIGGRDYKEKNFNRAYKMNQRQPGSVLKPLAVYGPALEKEEYTPYMNLPDKQQEIDGKEVKNADNQYDGSISMYNALIRSKNTTAAWLLNEIGVDYADDYLRKMGMDFDTDSDKLSLALGGTSKGLTPVQIAEAYRTFANGGEWGEGHAITEITNRKGDTVAAPDLKETEVFSKQVSWTMTEMLQDVVNNGTGTAGYYPYELAGKTGTTNKNNDFWFAGYTPDYVTSMWMGNDEGDHSLEGSSAMPTELTKKILTELSESQEVTQQFSKPEGIEELEEPIDLPVIKEAKSTTTFGGWKVLKGKLQWEDAGDDRIVYRIYEETKGEGKDKKIGEVTGETEFVIDDFLLFQKRNYYIVPYDPIGDQTGERSNTVELSM